MRSLQPTNLAYQLRNQWHIICYDQLSGWLHRPIGNPVYSDLPAHGHHTGFISRGFLPLWELLKKGQSFNVNRLPDLSSKLSPKVFSTRGYFCMTAGVWNQLSISVVSCQRLLSLTCPFASYTVGSHMWLSPMTKMLGPIVATALRVGFQKESFGPATGGFTFNCPMPEAWTMETSWQ